MPYPAWLHRGHFNPRLCSSFAWSSAYCLPAMLSIVLLTTHSLTAMASRLYDLLCAACTLWILIVLPQHTGCLQPGTCTLSTQHSQFCKSKAEVLGGSTQKKDKLHHRPALKSICGGARIRILTFSACPAFSALKSRCRGARIHNLTFPAISAFSALKSGCRGARIHILAFSSGPE